MTLTQVLKMLSQNRNRCYIIILCGSFVVVFVGLICVHNVCTSCLPLSPCLHLFFVLFFGVATLCLGLVLLAPYRPQSGYSLFHISQLFRQSRMIQSNQQKFDAMWFCYRMKNYVFEYAYLIRVSFHVVIVFGLHVVCQSIWMIALTVTSIQTIHPILGHHNPTQTVD